MAYGVEAGVALLIGGTDTTFYTSANITLAIAHADVLVDSINSNASATAKTAASDLIAAELLKHGSANKKLKGLSSVGGISGRPPISGEGHEYTIPKSVYTILAHKSDEPHFNTDTPSSSGEW